MRAAPPARAADDPERRTVFAAGLEQAEQFIHAAYGVGFQTKPVQLFYALSQAGRAIAAAYADDPWQVTGHGASVKERDDLGETRVTLHNGGALPLVASATGSETWAGEVTLGQLWASLPELPYEEHLCGDAAPALALVKSPFQNARIGGMPRVQGGATAQAGLQLGERFASREEERRKVADALAPYPAATGWGIVNGWMFTEQVGPPPVWLSWEKEEEGTTFNAAVETVTEEWQRSLYLRPGLGEGGSIPSRLVSWWGILLALSSLARYQPVLWRASLDIDASPIAYALEEGLRIAGSRVPELIVETLEAG